jgi:hypothetical protein
MSRQIRSMQIIFMINPSFQSLICEQHIRNCDWVWKKENISLENRVWSVMKWISMDWMISYSQECHAGDYFILVDDCWLFMTISIPPQLVGRVCFAFKWVLNNCPLSSQKKRKNKGKSMEIFSFSPRSADDRPGRFGKIKYINPSKNMSREIK